MLDKKYYVPRHLDDPPKFLLWSLDEAMVLLVPFIIGVLLSQVVIGMVLGVLSMLMVRRLKSKEGSNILFSLLYWHFPINRFSHTPPSYIRTYIG